MDERRRIVIVQTGSRVAGTGALWDNSYSGQAPPLRRKAQRRAG
ncbi:hypothetical protein [Actinophytocola sp.]